MHRIKMSYGRQIDTLTILKYLDIDNIGSPGWFGNPVSHLAARLFISDFPMEICVIYELLSSRNRNGAG